MEYVGNVLLILYSMWLLYLLNLCVVWRQHLLRPYRAYILILLISHGSNWPCTLCGHAVLASIPGIVLVEPKVGTVFIEAAHGLDIAEIEPVSAVRILYWMKLKPEYVSIYGTVFNVGNALLILYPMWMRQLLILVCILLSFRFHSGSYSREGWGQQGS